MPELHYWAQCGHLWPDIDHTDHRCMQRPGHADAHHCCCGEDTDE